MQYPATSNVDMTAITPTHKLTVSFSMIFYLYLVILFAASRSDFCFAAILLRISVCVLFIISFTNTSEYGV